MSLRKKSASSLHKSVVKIMFYKKSFTNFESVLRNVIVKIFSSASAHVWARVHLVRFQLVNRDKAPLLLTDTDPLFELTDLPTFPYLTRKDR